MDERVKAAIEAAQREGRIISQKGVNVEALLAGDQVRKRAPDYQQFSDTRFMSLEFLLQALEQRIEAVANESEFQGCVMDLAAAFGWRRVHWRKVLVKQGKRENYETPYIGDGKGFPDLELVRERLIKAELKFGPNKPTPEQLDWMDSYRMAGVECYVWYPTDWRTIVDTLKPI